MRQDSENFKVPILLPGKHIAVERLIQQEHKESHHCGGQVLRSIIREKFWIIKARVVVNEEIKKCVRCKRFQAKRFEAPEAPLPLNRVRDATSFEIVGIDLGGPLYLDNKEKAWFVVFTCAVYRAVHLELITTLSTIGFIQALRRFIARRCRPAVIYTDNGGNFVGTENLMKELDWDEIIRTSPARNIKWIFNPPAAPWWGGWWERIVRMVKQLLRRNLGKALLNYEELETMLCDCERVINTRPLTYLSEDNEELIPLTPMMFLNDARSNDVVDLDIIESNFKGRFKYLQEIRQELRDRFRKEYLSELVHHNIRKSGASIAIGDIVIVELADKKRIDWPIARVEKLFPGCDGVVRSVELRTSKGKLDRAIQKLYLLEASTSDLEKPVEIESIGTVKGTTIKDKKSLELMQEGTTQDLVKEEENSIENNKNENIMVSKSGRKLTKTIRFSY